MGGAFVVSRRVVTVVVNVGVAGVTGRDAVGRVGRAETVRIARDGHRWVLCPVIAEGCDIKESLRVRPQRSMVAEAWITECLHWASVASPLVV
jgi:hypothetical protein